MKAIILIIVMVFTHPSLEGTKAKVTPLFMFDTTASCTSFAEASNNEIVTTARVRAQESGATLKHVFATCHDMSSVDYPKDSRAGSY